MPDFRVYTSWRTHRKRKRLQRALKIEAVQAVQDLWAYAADERPDGDLTGLTNDDIACEANYDGDPDEFCWLLRDIRLLDGDVGQFKIHNWAKRQPFVSTRDKGSDNAQWANHCRWHRDAGDYSEECRFCNPQSPEDHAAISIRTSAGSDRTPPDSTRKKTESPSLPPSQPPDPPMREISAGEQKSSSVPTVEIVETGQQRLGLQYPGGRYLERICRIAPVDRGVFDEAVSSTANAAKPNWNYLLKCLEKPHPVSTGPPRNEAAEWLMELAANRGDCT